MDLIYTDSTHIDQGVLSAFSVDFSYGSSENDFEVTLGKSEPQLEKGAFIYIEGTEFGGIVDGMRVSSNSETRVYFGRTLHGLLNSKIITPANGDDYYVLDGEANKALFSLINKIGLWRMIDTPDESSGVYFHNYKLPRYCKGYDGIRDALAAHGAKLKLEWNTGSRTILASVVPIANYTEQGVDSDMVHLEIEQHYNKVNHLICLGRGELADREVIHLYIDSTGNISEDIHYRHENEVVDVYDYPNAESIEELRQGGIKRLTELRNIDKTEIELKSGEQLEYDIGDIVSATDINTGVTVSDVVTQKIIRIKNGAISIEYKTGG